MAETKTRTDRQTIQLVDGIDNDDPTTVEKLDEMISHTYGPAWCVESIEGFQVTIARKLIYKDVSADLQTWADDLYDRLFSGGDTITPLYIAAGYHGLADFSHLGRVVGLAQERGDEDAMGVWIGSHFRRVAADLRLISEGKNARGASVNIDSEVAYSCDRIRQTQEVTQGTPRLREAVTESSRVVGLQDVSHLVAQIRVPEHRLAQAFEELPQADVLLAAASQLNDERGDHGHDPLAPWKRDSGGWWAMGLGRVMHRLGDLLEWKDFEVRKSDNPDTQSA